MNKSTIRRVTVMMMNSHQHIELIEINTAVVMSGTLEKVEFKCITKDADTKARELLARAEMDVDDFSIVGILVSCLYGPLAGRIVWAKEAEVTTKTITKIS